MLRCACVRLGVCVCKNAQSDCSHKEVHLFNRSSLTTFVHCCSILTYSIVAAPPPFDLASPALSLYLFLFTPLPASSLLRPPFTYCAGRSASGPVVSQSLPSFYLVLIPSHPSSQFTRTPFLQHLVFSLYHRWSIFHAGLLHGLMPSLCVYAVCVLFGSPTCHSETHWFVWGLSGSTQTFHSAGCHSGQAIMNYTSERELSAGQ